MSSPYPDINPCLRFHRAYAQLVGQLGEELAIYHGIDFGDFSLLHLLSGNEGSSSSLAILAAELGVSRSTMLRRLRPLEKIGLVACDSGAVNRHVVLRPAGLALLRTAHDTVAGVYAKNRGILSIVDAIERSIAST